MSVNLNLYDPFNDGNSTRNLNADFWWQAQHTEDCLETASVIRKITHEDSLVAAIPMHKLIELNEDITLHAGLSCLDITMSFLSTKENPAHWTAICLAMLSHTTLELFHRERIYKFIKSSGSEDPLFGANVIIEVDSRGYIFHYRKGTERPDDFMSSFGVKKKKVVEVEKPQLSLF